ncbi:MAG: erythromycin biosynthesis sensory transduction protein eryC1 [Planctomycetes bacterium B3_Pla]|nr:MAG: erythromycin biosynthesis sensory transduction protein eryC1 [Planctomycetes bacterium B3_Pla]
MRVPFLDLKIQYESIRDEIAEALQQVLDNTAFAGGPFVEEFEKDFASFCQCEFAIGVGSGTTALWMALSGLGIGEGDEVITTPNTFIATVEAISFCGAKPVFVDVDERTYNMNPDLLEDNITPRTKAIIPVHLYGQMADMDRIMQIASVHGLFVVEDACQAHGAEYKGRRAGSIGDAGCFSFYPGKNLGAYGEAGAIVTNNTELAEKMRMFRDHGQAKKYYHSMIGWNARMDGFQGAVLSVKLKHLPGWNDARRKNAQLYNDLLANVKSVITPAEADYARHVYHIYAIRAQNRDAFIRGLAEKDISCGIHYPVPVHLQEAYAQLGHGRNSFPAAEKCADEFVSLPMFAELSAEQIEKVAREINCFLERSTPIGPHSRPCRKFRPC